MNSALHDLNPIRQVPLAVGVDCYIRRAGHSASGEIVAEAEVWDRDDLLHTDRVNLTRALERTQFAEAVVAARPDLSLGVIQGTLLEVAASLTALLGSAEADLPAPAPAETVSGNCGNCGQEGAEDDWQPPLPFHSFDLPSFPVDALPSPIREMVIAEAEATQTPLDLSALLALSCCALTIAKRFEVCVRPGYCEPTNIWTMSSTRPGTRSTQVFRDLAAPVEEYERSQAEEEKAKIAADSARYEITRKRAERAREQAARCDDPTERAELEADAICLAQELSVMCVPVPLRLMADDVSPEKLASLLAEQGGRMAILSPEGGLFEQMGGRYSSNGAPNLDVYLKAHAGDTLRVDRIGRPPEFVRDPALTLGLRVQPDVLRGLADKPGFRGRGLLARFIYGLPPDTLGKRKVRSQPVPATIRESYRRRLLAMLQLPAATAEDGQPTPRRLLLSPEEEAALDQFAGWLEPQLDEWGELGSMTDWAGKLVGAVARIAGILHVAEHAEGGEPWTRRISKETILAAIRIGRYAIPHARAAFAQMAVDPLVAEARHILAWIERHGQGEFTKRDCWQGVRGRYQRVEEMEPALRLLMEHGYIREKPEERTRGRGRPSVIFEVNPLGQKSQYSQKPGSEGGFGGFGISGLEEADEPAASAAEGEWEEVPA
jgi:replicative DNA helicase